MRRSLLVLFAAAVASGFMLTSALGDATYTDPTGDATGNAPDITDVQVTNDNGGQITFNISVTNLTPESDLFVFLDTDKNATTGDHGSDYVLEWQASSTPANNGWWFGKWNGSDYIHPDQHPTVAASLVPTGVQFTLNKSEIDGTTGFSFSIGAVRYTADAVTGIDVAPDGVLNWNYDLTTPPPPPTTTTPTTPATTTPTPTPTVVKPVFGTPKTVPAKLVAGKKVVFTLAVKRSDTGAPLTTGKMICDPSVSGKVVTHAESFKGGTAKLVFTVPKTAKGKLLKVKVTIVNGKQSATKIVTYKVS